MKAFSDGHETSKVPPAGKKRPSPHSFASLFLLSSSYLLWTGKCPFTSASGVKGASLFQESSREFKREREGERARASECPERRERRMSARG